MDCGGILLRGLGCSPIRPASRTGRLRPGHPSIERLLPQCTTGAAVYTMTRRRASLALVGRWRRATPSDQVRRDCVDHGLLSNVEIGGCPQQHETFNDTTATSEHHGMMA